MPFYIDWMRPEQKTNDNETIQINLFETKKYDKKSRREKEKWT